MLCPFRELVLGLDCASPPHRLISTRVVFLSLLSTSAATNVSLFAGISLPLVCLSAHKGKETEHQAPISSFHIIRAEIR